MKTKDLVRHKKLGWIGQVREIENQQKAYHYLSNWLQGRVPWKPYYVVTVVLEEDGVILLDDLEEWEII